MDCKCLCLLKISHRSEAATGIVVAFKSRPISILMKQDIFLRFNYTSGLKNFKKFNILDKIILDYYTTLLMDCSQLSMFSNPIVIRLIIIQELTDYFTL